MKKLLEYLKNLIFLARKHSLRIIKGKMIMGGDRKIFSDIILRDK